MSKRHLKMLRLFVKKSKPLPPKLPWRQRLVFFVKSQFFKALLAFVGIVLASLVASLHYNSGSLVKLLKEDLSKKAVPSGPTLFISAPSLAETASRSVSFTLTYLGTDFITLQHSDVTLLKSGSAEGQMSISGTGTMTRLVTISNISGDGSLGLLVSPSAHDFSGRLTQTASSSFVLVDNTRPRFILSPPSKEETNRGPVSYTVTYDDVSKISLDNSFITLLKTGTAEAKFLVTETGSLTRAVTLSEIKGDGSLAIQIQEGSALDKVGNTTLGQTSLPFNVDNTPPKIFISAPSATITVEGPVSLSLTASGAQSFELKLADLSLIKTQTAEAKLSLREGFQGEKIVTLSELKGEGTLRLSVSASVASDAIGNLSLAETASETILLGCPAGEKIFNYTGAVQYFVVPPRCTKITALVVGGAGGSIPRCSSQGGKGAALLATFDVTASEKLEIFVAGQGAQGDLFDPNAYGAGGGGASAIVRLPSKLLLLAGGGGGAASDAECPGAKGSGEDATKLASTCEGSVLPGSDGSAPSDLDTQLYDLVPKGGWGYKTGGKGGIGLVLHLPASGGGGAGIPGGLLNDKGTRFGLAGVSCAGKAEETQRSSGPGFIKLSWGY